MDDIVTLGIKIDSLQAEVAAHRMEKLADKGTKAEKSALSMGAAFKVAAAGAVLLGGAIYKILEKTSEFQVLNANLVTATGGIEGANKAFAALKVLATTTPFTLQEVTTAFTKLVNYGLTPSERAIRSYGDAAAATGKPIISLVEGVADAVNGEFERVKEAFNVKAKNLGDTVAFRFRGVTTEVKNNAKDIEEYFIRLGETKFAGAMGRQMDTLKGKFSNAQDAWELMLNAMGSGRMQELAKGGLTDITDKLNDITQWAESGGLNAAMYQIEAVVASQVPQWESLGLTIGKVLGDGTKLIGELVADAQPDSAEWDQYWHDVFTHFPSNIEYMIKLSQIHLGGFVDKSAVVADRFKSIWEKAVGAVADELAASALAFKHNLSGITEGRALVAQARSKQAADAAAAQGYSPLGGGAPATEEDINKRIEEQTDKLNADTEAAQKNADAHIDRAAKMRQSLAEVDSLLAELDANNSSLLPPPLDPGNPDAYNTDVPPVDALAGFYQGGDPSTSNSPGKVPKAKRVRESRATNAEYESQLLDTIYEREAQNELEALDQSEDRIRLSYDKRKAEILANTSLTEQQKAELIKRSDAQLAAATEDSTRKRNEAQLKLAGEFFGNLSTISGAFGKKGHKAAQAAAIAKTLMDTYSSATASYNALASIPYVGPALGFAAAGAAVAAGYANIQKIRSTEYTGAYADGGIVPGNSTRGDRLFARVNSKEAILNQGQQKRLLDLADGAEGGKAGGGAPWRVNITNTAPGYTAEVNEDREAKVMEITINRTMDRIAAETQRGGGRVDKALQGAYKLKR